MQRGVEIYNSQDRRTEAIFFFPSSPSIVINFKQIDQSEAFFLLLLPYYYFDHGIKGLSKREENIRSFDNRMQFPFLLLERLLLKPSQRYIELNCVVGEIDRRSINND